jgi:hypothetical protein
LEVFHFHLGLHEEVPMVRNAVVRNLGKFSMNLWRKLPPNMVESRSFRTLGGRYSVPRMGGGTYFLRNVPLLNAVAEQIQNMYRAETGGVRMCVIGCCTGAEVYSAHWVLQKPFSADTPLHHRRGYLR